jgi:ubiquinol-cytochrome c reductase iron-sulfur subunit
MTDTAKKTSGIKITRRDFLAAFTTVLGAGGVAAATIPFIKALSPTKDILSSAIIEADISDLKEGGLKTIIWEKQPVFILRRTPEMIKKSSLIDPTKLTDPATPDQRVIRPDLFVSLAICTHLGCIPRFVEKLPDMDISGFYCPCHGGKYDTLGRRLGGPPPENLHLVPYKIESDTRLVIGTENFSGYEEDIRKLEEFPKV